VIVDIAHANIDKCFTYTFDPTLAVQPGMRVLVPFGAGNRPTEGFVLSTSEEPTQPCVNLKQIVRVLDPYPAIGEDQLELCHYIKKTYHCLLVDALRLMIPAQMRGGRVKEKTVQTIQIAPGTDLSKARSALLKKDGSVKYPAQMAVLDLLEQTGIPMAVSDVLACLPEAKSAILTLLKKGILQKQAQKVNRTPTHLPYGKNASEPPALTDEQRAAVDLILPSLHARSAQTYLLHGVTGSGKTEVYMHLIADCLASDRQAIVLVPEIALTPQTTNRFLHRFGERVAVLHSRLSAGERYDEWQRIRTGEAQVVVGARSAVFAPVKELGIIIIDEEHEHSYQSDHTPRYHAVQIARKRCELTGATLVLGSATPSIVSYLRARTGSYQLVELTKRVLDLPLPGVQIVDLREEFLSGNNSIFSAALKSKLKTCIGSGKQAILLMNRRGYATFISCRGCGHVFTCPDCDVAMTYHRYGERIKCHYCGREAAVPHTCPACGKAYLKHFGVGTQQVEEQLLALFPDVKTLRVDFDTTRTKDAHQKLLSAFANGEAQVLIGTQMIAKGLDFPNVTLVGVVAADASLYIPDYRSAERAFQLFTQVAGRAGRAGEKGDVVIQTYSPSHPSIYFAKQHDFQGFFAYELAQRKAALFPPFSAFVRVLFLGEEQESLEREGSEFALCCKERVLQSLGQGNERELLYDCACFAPIAKREGIYRFMVLFKLLRTKHTTGAVDAIYTCAGEHARHPLVEVNPSNLF